MGERRYGQWHKMPEGFPEDTTRCVEEVTQHLALRSSQCSRPRGHGKAGLYCRQHAKRHQDEEQK